MNYFYQKLLWECDFEETTPMRVAFSRHLLKVAAALKAVEWVDSGDWGPGDEDGPIAEVLGSTNRAQRMRSAGYTRRPTLREISEPEQQPEGVVVFHTAGNVGFKRTLEKDEIPKTLVNAIEAKLREINT